MGTVLSGLEWARRVLRNRHPSLDAMGDDYLQYAAAAVTVVDNFKRNRDEQRPVRFHDAAPRRQETPRQCVDRWAAVYDQERAAEMKSQWLDTWRDQTTEVGQPAGGASPNGQTPGAVGGGKVGARLIQRLPGPASSYHIQALGDGSAGLFQSSNIDGVIDPGQTSVADRQRRALFEYQAIKTRGQLRAINEANHAFWEKHQR